MWQNHSCAWALRRVLFISAPHALRKSSLRWLPLLMMLVLAALAGCERKTALRSRSGTEWQQLLSAAQSIPNAKSPQAAALLQTSLATNKPMWPVDSFLRAESYRLQGDTQKARALYRALAEWGAQDPYEDGWGGDGLAAMALWRWIHIATAASSVDLEEVSRLLDCAEKLQPKRLIRGVYSTPLLTSLPQLEEESVRGLARLAWLAGQKNQAERLFLDYLQLARTRDRDAVEQEIWSHLVQSGQASEDRLSLLVAIRLNALGQQETAASMFRPLRESNDSMVRAQAGYYLAVLEQLRGAPRKAVLDMLSAALEDAADPRLSQQILLQRALAYNRPGTGRDHDRFVQDLLRLIADFPGGSLVDNALYELARDSQRANDAQQALIYFGRVQLLENATDRFELSYFQAMLTLYERAAPGDAARASQLLQELIRKRPDASLRLPALFWLGRLAEDSGDAKQAQGYFQQIMEESPYDYYAIRARMHLTYPSDARRRLLPDEQATAALGSAYRAAAADVAFPEDSPYAARLREGLQSGLFQQGLQADQQLRRLYPSRRAEELSSRELDSPGLLAPLAVLLAFRQDALAANDLHPQSRAQIALAAGRVGQDWPLAIFLCHRARDVEGPVASLQGTADCLPAAYPLVFGQAFRAAGVAHGVAPALLYAVARRESFFYASALSPSGGLGLFQFRAPTFAALDRQWSLLGNAGVSSYQEYVLNPDRSIDLGARWFQEKLLATSPDNLVPALFEHNAGKRPALEWARQLRDEGRFEDVEFAIESIPSMETRRFVRTVIADMVIISAAGVLIPESSRSLPSPASAP